MSTEALRAKEALAQARAVDGLCESFEKAHLRGDKSPGPIKRGLGVSIHAWGGMGHDSECDVTINPDGSVETKTATQDLGVGICKAFRNHSAV